jgi:hypothetical protein
MLKTKIFHVTRYYNKTLIFLEQNGVENEDYEKLALTSSKTIPQIKYF